MIRTARSYLGYCKKWRGEFSSEVVRVGLAVIFMGRWLLLLLVNVGTLGTMANVSARVSAQRRVAMALLFRRWYAE
jgi:hypothetical protein